MKVETRITSKAPGFRFVVIVGGKIVASGHRSTKVLANVAAQREAAVYKKMSRRTKR